MLILPDHQTLRKLAWIVFLSLLIFQCNCINLQSQINQAEQINKAVSIKRNLQSSYLGFDLSFLTSQNGGLTSLQPSTTFSQSSSNQVSSLPFSNSRNQQPLIKNTQVSQLKTDKTSNQVLNYQKILNNQFNSITLYHNIPTKFLMNQIYTFKGTVTNPTATKVNVLFSLISDPNIRMSLSHSLNGKKQFQIPFTMSISGKFYLTIFTGSSGDSSRTQYEVLETTEYKKYEIGAPAQIQNLVIFQKDNKIIVKWSNNNAQKYPVVKLTFQQFSTMSKAQFIVSNFVNQFTLPLKAFIGFQKSTVSLAAVQAKSSSSSSYSRVSEFSIAKMIYFDTEQHNFSESRTDLVQIDDFGYIFSPDKGALSISGKSLSKLKNQVVVLQPSNTFRSYLINNFVGELGQVPANSNINLSIDISQQGVYIIEINHSSGIAVLNRPVYVGRNIIPLIPDSEDLKDSSRSPALIVSQQPKLITEQRNLFLGLINSKRVEFGLEEVYLDDKLNLLAQQHSEDMVRRSYSSHYTPQGLAPTDRARNNKIYEEVGQNIGQNSDLIDAHNRLCRSNIHLRNIVKQNWVRVGLGIKLNSNNSFIVTQQFSTKDLTKDPLTQSQLNTIKSDVISYVLYSARVVRSENIDLSQRIASWHQQRSSATSSQLSNFIKSLNYSRYSGVVIKLGYSSSAAQSIKNSQYLLPPSNSYTQIGMSIKFNNGFLQVYIGYVA